MRKIVNQKSSSDIFILNLTVETKQLKAGGTKESNLRLINETGDIQKPVTNNYLAQREKILQHRSSLRQNYILWTQTIKTRDILQ